MWYTPLFPLLPPAPLIFPVEHLLLTFWDLFVFQCVVLLSFLCVMVVDFSAFQHWYCYSFCSKGKCHLQNSMSMMGLPHLSYQFLQTLGLISIVFIGLCCVCLPCLWTVFTSRSFNMISRLHVVHHISPPSFQL